MGVGVRVRMGVGVSVGGSGTGIGRTAGVVGAGVATTIRELDYRRRSRISRSSNRGGGSDIRHLSECALSYLSTSSTQCK